MAATSSAVATVSLPHFFPCRRSKNGAVSPKPPNWVPLGLGLGLGIGRVPRPLPLLVRRRNNPPPSPLTPSLSLSLSSPSPSPSPSRLVPLFLLPLILIYHESLSWFSMIFMIIFIYVYIFFSSSPVISFKIMIIKKRYRTGYDGGGGGLGFPFPRKKKTVQYYSCTGDEVEYRLRNCGVCSRSRGRRPSRFITSSSSSSYSVFRDKSSSSFCVSSKPKLHNSFVSIFYFIHAHTYLSIFELFYNYY